MWSEAIWTNWSSWPEALDSAEEKRSRRFAGRDRDPSVVTDCPKTSRPAARFARVLYPGGVASETQGDSSLRAG
jgi:hypothetical protein